MRIKIRKGCFETNSSTVHAICINKDRPKQKITSIILDCKEEFSNKNHNIEEKIKYIFKMCLVVDMENPIPYFEKEKSYVYKLVSYLAKKGITVEIKKYDDYYTYGVGDCEEFLKMIMNNESLLDDFIFDEDSYFHIMDNNYVEENLPSKSEYDIYTFSE